MSTAVSWNGLTYNIPGTADEAWSGPNAVDGLLISLAQNGFQKTGGLFTLSADVDFGPLAGTVNLYFKSRSSNIATTGVFRLANADTISWRNAANNADLAITVNSSNNLLFNGNQIISSAGALSASQVAVTNGSAVLTTAASLASNLGGTGVANNVANTLTYVGNFGLTFTLSGATAVTLPTSGTLSTLAGAESPTNKTFDSTSTGTGMKIASFTPDGTHTLTAPAVTDTLAAIAAAQTLTNKTIAAGSNTISGLTNSNLSGSAAITNANHATMLANTIKGNNTGSSATPVDMTVAQALTLLGFTGSTIGSTGYIILPGGLYLQWISSAGGSAGGTTTNWAIAFPNALFAAVASPSNQNTSFQLTATTAHVVITVSSGTPSFFVIAIGN